MTRIEQILKAALEGRQVDFAPLSREEVLLIQLSQKIAAGGADPETIKNAVDEYLRNNPIGLDDTLTDPTKAAPANLVGDIKDDIAQQWQESDAEKPDFDIADDNGNVLARFENGHVKTLNFDSEQTASIASSTAVSDFDISDGNGAVVLRVMDGFPQTRQFDGKAIKTQVTEIEKVISGSGGSVIPDYWAQHIADAEAKINANNMAMGANGVSFVFLTDYHQNTSNKASIQLIRHIMDNTSVSSVVYGGDTTDGGSYTREQCLDFIRSFAQQTRNLGMLWVRGNHDVEPQYNNQEKVITDAEYYDIALRPLESKVVLHGMPYYYADNPAQKVRYIILDTGSSTNLLNATQLEWMKARITELSAEWTVIIFLHEAATNNDTAHTIALNTRGNSLESAIASIKATMQCTIAAVVFGHSHVDCSFTSANGYPLIGVTCDSAGVNAAYDWNYPIRQAGTVEECAFDVFSVDTANRTIKVVRVGAGADVEREFVY